MILEQSFVIHLDNIYNVLLGKISDHTGISQQNSVHHGI